MVISESFPESVMIFGCGYVGSALAKHCLAAGVRVGALTRNLEKAEALRALGVAEVVVADLDRHSWHEQVTGSYKAVVNCVSSAGGGLEGYRKSYVEGQASILKWAEQQSIQRFVYTSSTSVYPQDGGVDVEETADTSTASPTGQVIVESEALIAQAAALFENWYVLRLAGIYGPGRHYLLNLLQEGAGAIPGRGDYALNMIHLEDIVSSICFALVGQAPSGIYNIADDSDASKAEVLNWLASELGVETPRFAPENVSPRLARRGGRMPDRKIVNRKALELLGWSPKFASYQEGYRALIQAQKSRNP